MTLKFDSLDKFQHARWSMPGSQDHGQPAPVDRAALAAISQGDEATERRLLEVFLKSSIVDAAALETAFAQRDGAAVMRAAHRMLGSSRIAGANAIAAACVNISHAAHNGDWDAIRSNQDVLSGELERVGAYLEIRRGIPP